jgi:hypothetical protein
VLSVSVIRVDWAKLLRASPVIAILLLVISSYGGHEHRWKEAGSYRVLSSPPVWIAVFVYGLKLPFPIRPEFSVKGTAMDQLIANSVGFSVALTLNNLMYCPMAACSVRLIGCCPASARWPPFAFAMLLPATFTYNTAANHR